MKKLLAFFSVLVFAGVANAQCSNGNCPAPSYSTHVGYVWKEYDWREIHLWKDGRQVGGWNLRDGYFLPIVNGKWGSRCNPPVPLPAQYQVTIRPFVFGQ